MAFNCPDNLVAFSEDLELILANTSALSLVKCGKQRKKQPEGKKKRASMSRDALRASTDPTEAQEGGELKKPLATAGGIKSMP